MGRGSDVQELAAVAAVVREGSFRKAARSLSLSPSALSHLVRAAEARLGVRLLNRTSRTVAPTEAGLALAGRVAPALAEIADAEREARSRGASPTGAVRLSVPRLVAHLVLAPRLGEIARRLPSVRLDVRVEEVLVDVVGQGLDAGIRLHERVPRDMVAVPVTGPIRGIVVASPALVAAQGAPTSPRDLPSFPCIGFRFPTSGALLQWEFAQGGERLAMDVGGPLVVDDTDLAVAAAQGGVGLAYVPDLRVAPHVADGRLVQVLADWSPVLPGFQIYFPQNRLVPPALRAVVDLLRYTG